MPYNRPRYPNPKPPVEDPGQAIDESPGFGDFLDVGRSGWAGLMGKNYAQWGRDKKKKNQPSQNWLQRLIAPK